MILSTCIQFSVSLLKLYSAPFLSSNFLFLHKFTAFTHEDMSVSGDGFSFSTFLFLNMVIAESHTFFHNSLEHWFPICVPWNSRVPGKATESSVGQSTSLRNMSLTEKVSNFDKCLQCLKVTDCKV